MPPTRSIVIPAYMEASFIGSTLSLLLQYLIEKDWLDTTEVIVVTADANDGTVEITTEVLKVFPLHQHIKPGHRVGKGRDVKAGLAAARADQVLFMDADLATPLEYVEPAFKLLSENGGIVIGVRDLKSMHKTVSRKISSVASNTLVRTLIGWKIPDSQCGFKAFTRQAIDVILPRSVVMGWGFDFEFIKVIRVHKLPITLLPIPDWHDPKPEGTGLAGDSQVEAMKQTFKELVQVKSNQRKGLYR
ncbi:MAG: glycosyltransferase [bacterium]|nr:glycosyltransferase [bacterium]